MRASSSVRGVYTSDTRGTKYSGHRIPQSDKLFNSLVIKTNATPSVDDRKYIVILRIYYPLLWCGSQRILRRRKTRPTNKLAFFAWGTRVRKPRSLTLAILALRLINWNLYFTHSTTATFQYPFAPVGIGIVSRSCGTPSCTTSTWVVLLAKLDSRPSAGIAGHHSFLQTFQRLDPHPPKNHPHPAAGAEAAPARFQGVVSGGGT